MTRINLISVEKLSDQHLMAEYRELPRIVNAVINNKVITKDIPESYRLGRGHVRFFYNKILFLAERFRLITEELKYREFSINPNFSYDKMLKKIKNSNYNLEVPYEYCEEEIQLSQHRIAEKISQKPYFYKWTKRLRPF